MKTLRNILIVWTVCAAALLTGCKNDSLSTGESLLDEQDKIIVFGDTVSIRTDLMAAGRVITNPDTLLLGEMETPYGSLKADILTQFACPEGFKYPDNAIPDSLVLFITYDSWVGDGETPLEVDAWYMDKRTLSINQRYYSDLDITKYCSKDDSTRVLRDKQIIVPSESNDYPSSTTHVVMLPLRQEFCDRIFAYRDFEGEGDRTAQDLFNEYFKGLYITTTFGGSNIIHINSIQLTQYYHFTYSKAGVDTTVYTGRSFYATTEVRQINRYEYLENATPVDLVTRCKTDDAHCYVISPAGVYTTLDIPLRQMRDTVMDHMINHLTGDTIRRPYVNRAKLRMDVVNKYTGESSDITSADWAQPATYMLLIREDAMDRWFVRRENISDTCAVYASLSSETDSLGRVSYFYTYDLSTIVEQSLQPHRADTLPECEETLRLVLMPVDLTTTTSSSSSYYYSSSSSTTVIGIQASQVVSNTIIHSGESPTHPLRLELVYSGF